MRGDEWNERILGDPEGKLSHVVFENSEEMPQEGFDLSLFVSRAHKIRC
jgi:hypothetical protein